MLDHALFLGGRGSGLTVVRIQHRHRATPLPIHPSLREVESKRAEERRRRTERKMRTENKQKQTRDESFDMQGEGKGACGVKE